MTRSLRTAWIALILMGVLAGSLGCGKYGPPVRPDKDPSNFAESSFR